MGISVQDTSDSGVSGLRVSGFKFKDFWGLK